MKYILFSLFFSSSVGYAQSSIKPMTFDLELLETETEYKIPDSLDENDRVSVAKLNTNLGFSQTFNQIEFDEDLGVEIGKSLNDNRQFSNTTANLSFLKKYRRSNFQGSLLGNWGKGQDITSSLNSFDQIIVDDPNEVESRYLNGTLEYQYTISSLSQITSTVTQERYSSLDQEYLTNTGKIAWTKVATDRSTIGLQTQYSEQRSSEDNLTIYLSLIANWNYLLQERNILTFNLGNITTRQDNLETNDLTGEISYLYLFFNNKVLQDWSFKRENTGDSEPIDLSSDKIVDRVFAESLSNSFSISWSRSVASSEQGSSLALTNTASMILNNTITRSSTLVTGLQYSKRVDTGTVESQIEDSNGYLNYYYNLDIPTKGEVPPYQFRSGYNYSQTFSIENRQRIRRHTVFLGLFLAF